MNPTPGQVTSIRQFAQALASGWSNTDAQIRAAMAAAAVANPVQAAPTVPKPFKSQDLIGALSATSQANLKSFTGLGSLLDDIHTMNIERCQTWAGFMAVAAVITAAERTALLAVVNATYADPAWTSTIPWDVANLGRTADDFDIEAARHS